MSKRNNNYLFLLLVLVLSSCGDNGSGPSKNYTEARRKVAVNNADYALNAYSQLSIVSRSLNDAVDAFTAQTDIETLDSLRQVLDSFRIQWQRIAMFQIGPAETYLLRSSINTYPADTDKIEGNIQSGNYTLGSVANTGAEGFAAIGYLIHGVGYTDAEIISMFTEPGSDQRKEYLSDLAKHLETLISNVEEEWSPGGGNYYSDFVSDQSLGTDIGSSLSLLVNAYELHLQRFLRDGKVGIPAGVRSAGVPRPNATEAFFAGRSSHYLVIALEAMKDVYTGAATTENFSLQDYLVELDFAELATEIELQFDQVISKASELEDPLSGVIEANNDLVLEVFVEIQKLTPMIKSDMASAMGVIITNQDADGD